MHQQPIDPHKFDDLFDAEIGNQQSLDSWIAGKENLYEERMVKLVLIRLGLEKEIPSLQRELRVFASDHNATLTFTWFHKTYPTFPVRLCSTSYANTKNVTIVDLFKRMTSTLIYKKYMEAKELIPDGEQYGSWGLIFPWNGLGQVILHNNRHIEMPGTRILRTFGNRTASNEQTVYLDILIPFIQAIAQKWRS